ncbi:TPA: class I SAM-dependent methyltransferase [Pseudomonas aeruginosa]|nr:class I SAM-dependent methyltransferase [Pseudomonas aeruginosa]HCR1776749.1 class I SAM-dependent methyltransferase [Pseudomonas aeruginosa]
MTDKKPDTETIDYYNRNILKYDNTTYNLKLAEQWSEFLSQVKPQGAILDVGCGTGRDIVHFKNLGFYVEGIEPSTLLAKLARARTGSIIREASVENIEHKDRYDGIWACASLLHLPKASLPETLKKLTRALREDGCLYISLKQGTEESRKPDGRYFSSYLPNEITMILDKIPNISQPKIWITEDAALRSNTKWINILIKHKNSTTQS